MFTQIDVEQAEQLSAEGGCVVLDVRDKDSYEKGHISGAIHLTMPTLQQFIDSYEKNTTILVYCYHGISSQSVASHLTEQGFTEVFSLTGGYEKWLQHSHQKHD